MAKNKAETSPKNNPNVTRENSKEFSKNTKYKLGDKIEIGGITLYAKHDFESSDSFDPADWSNVDLTPKSSIRMCFTKNKVGYVNEPGEKIEIDITDLLKEKLGVQDISLIKREFSGVRFMEVRGDDVDEDIRYAVGWDETEYLRERAEKILSAVIVNQKQFNSINDLMINEFVDWNQNWRRQFISRY